jgi:hypothetical protein
MKRTADIVEILDIVNSIEVASYYKGYYTERLQNLLPSDSQERREEMQSLINQHSVDLNNAKRKLTDLSK